MDIKALLQMMRTLHVCIEITQVLAAKIEEDGRDRRKQARPPDRKRRADAV